MSVNSTANRHVMSVPDAGREYLNLGRNASYEAARRGDIPTIQIGKLLKVPVRAMERKLDEAGGEGYVPVKLSVHARRLEKRQKYILKGHSTRLNRIKP